MFYYPSGTVDTGVLPGAGYGKPGAASSGTHEWVGSEGSSEGLLFQQQILRFPQDDSELPQPHAGRGVCFFLLTLFPLRT